MSGTFMDGITLNILGNGGCINIRLYILLLSIKGNFGNLTKSCSGEIRNTEQKEMTVEICFHCAFTFCSSFLNSFPSKKQKMPY